ncbi:AcrR family transcriptional regulator [Methylobacterium brachiatum]|uniref:AcrR family transcriptional regulator n=1 Tax=Methylobacterium brachiatum TaxID=269660 RepID=A0AAJ1WUX0_9HYPH|nr:TetR/AcrR family transcriptional regulator [Methylobacterium brachiatum]MCB4802189.1 TetR/AcrR family transcriptional regulator [Methylobacterium brachiatum]MDQ0542532.1 AcrR family transcriptional regulator [Methylobacterium brachiatum]
MTVKEATRVPSRLGRPPRGAEGDATLRILAAAKPVFLNDGYEAASIDAIAASAGMSKKTIYTRFRSKEDLFEAVIVLCIEEGIPKIERSATDDGPVMDRLLRIASAVLEIGLTDECIAVRRIVVAEAARFPAFARLLNDQGLARIIPLIERCLEDGNRTGEIRVEDVRHVTDLFISIAIRSFVDKVGLGLERPGLTHVKRETLRRSVEFFMIACRG